MAAQDRINQLQKYMDFYKSSGMGGNPNKVSLTRDGGLAWSNALSAYNDTFSPAYYEKQAGDWAQKQADAENASQMSQAQSRAVDPNTALQMPDFYGKQGNSFNIPAYQAPQYRQSSPMPQYQGGSGVQNMLLELLRSRQPQNTFRQG